MGGGLYGDATGLANADSGPGHASNAWAIRVNPRSGSRSCLTPARGRASPCVPRRKVVLVGGGGADRAAGAGLLSLSVFSFKLVVLVEDRPACGEPVFHVPRQRFSGGRTLWGDAPEARGSETTTSEAPTGLWMTVQLFKKNPQGSGWSGHGARGTGPEARGPGYEAQGQQVGAPP